MHDLKIPSSLDTFKGSEDQNDAKSFIHDFQERLSLLEANDGIVGETGDTRRSRQAPSGPSMILPNYFSKSTTT
jgi:hypothetical protein